MRKEEKQAVIESMTQQLNENNNFYLADISELNAEKTSQLRRICFKNDVKLVVVKNTLLRKAMENAGKEYSELYDILKGATSVMFVYIGDNQLDFLTSIKSKNELIADLIALLQSPVKNVVGALQSGGHKLSGILQTLSEKSE
jgi:large subunit ribosomal protein L10